MSFRRHLTQSKSGPARDAAPPRADPGLGRFLQSALWRSLIQQAQQQQDWVWAAAIAHGLALCLLLGSLALASATRLLPDFNRLLLWLWQQWSTASTESLPQSWTEAAMGSGLGRSGLLLSGVAAAVLWLHGVGQLRRRLARMTVAASSQRGVWRRCTTLLLAIASAVLIGLAYGVVLLPLPAAMGATAATIPSPLWRQFGYGVQWSLALSTVALLAGLFYRSSFKGPPTLVPLLPGTVLATTLWTLGAAGLRLQLSQVTLPLGPIAYLSLLAIALVALYLAAVGLLLGGRLNALIGQQNRQHWQQQRPPVPPPPPSFETFTIQRRSGRSQ